ncbi:nickel insertion protein [Sinorhizobium psoraleae]|uniref:nickel insertion protein n=1 Tax=Sinorhizobium psoraleae TaxID=520838 RepID=UPI00289CC7A5|nr:nickel insertion protein [Sinorhizobium psoraleae]
MTKEAAMHIHLDAVGGIAGDMFVAGMLDGWPEFAGTVQENLRLADLESDVRAEVLAHGDGVLTGHRFDVTKSASEPVGDAKGRRSEHSLDHHAHDHEHHDHDHHYHNVHGHDHGHHHDSHGHDHTHWGSCAPSSLQAAFRIT